MTTECQIIYLDGRTIPPRLYGLASNIRMSLDKSGHISSQGECEGVIDTSISYLFRQGHLIRSGAAPSDRRDDKLIEWIDADGFAAAVIQLLRQISPRGYCCHKIAKGRKDLRPG